MSFLCWPSTRHARRLILDISNGFRTGDWSETWWVYFSWGRVGRIAKLLGDEPVEKAVEKAGAAFRLEAENCLMVTTFLAGGSLEDVTQIQPQKASEYASRASAFSCLGEFEFALDDLTQAINLDATNADFYFGRSGVYSHQDLHEQAIAELDEAIRLDPEHQSAIMWS